MACEPEIVIGAEHKDALAVNLGLRAIVVVQGLEKGIYLAVARLVCKREFVGLGEDVAAVLAGPTVREHGLDSHVGGELGEGGDGRQAVLFASSSLGHICVHYSIQKRRAKRAAACVNERDRLSARGVAPTGAERSYRERCVFGSLLR